MSKVKYKHPVSIPSPSSNTITTTTAVAGEIKNDERTPNDSKHYGFLDILSMECHEIFRKIDAPAQIQTTEIDAINNFFHVPLPYERLIFITLFLCADVILYNLSYFPLRAIRGVLCLLLDAGKCLTSGFVKTIRISYLYDICLGLIVWCSIAILYHAHIKEKEENYLKTNSLIALAAMTSMMEALDCLLTPFGNAAMDAMSSAFWLAFGGKSFGNTSSSSFYYPYLRFIHCMVIVIATTVLHSAVFFMHVLCYMKAIDNHSILSIIVMNNFAELNKEKNKKYSSDSLMTLTISEGVERFKILMFMICMTFLGTLHTKNNSTIDIIDTTSLTFLQTLCVSVSKQSSNFVIIWIWEILTDLIKHCFLCKDNGISASIYNSFSFVLKQDIIVAQSQPPPRDHSHAINRRLLLPQYAIVCVIIVSILHALDQQSDVSYLSTVLPLSLSIAFVVALGILTLLKVTSGACLLAWAYHNNHALVTEKTNL